MINIMYQNTQTGDAHEATTLVTSAKWTTKRTGAPASLELGLISHPDISWVPGGIVAVKSGNDGIFYGYTFKTSRNEKNAVTVTAYDQMRYLKNKDTYVFTGLRADQITAQIAEDFKIKTGSLANTGYVIPSMVEDNKALFDITLKALDLTLVNTGKMFYLWDDFGALCIDDVAASRLDLFVGDGSLATAYAYASDIDSETYNKIKLVRDNKETGKRDVYIFQDSNNMRLWGILQSYEKVNEALNEAQIRERGDKMLELYNRPKRTFEVAALSDLSVRAGRALYIGIAKLGVSQHFVVEEASHDLIKGTMNLKLRVV